MRIANDDLHALARIRTAAIDRFGREGFGVGLREVAEAAGVSLGLIRHHFGSKQGLRSACDEQIRAEIASAKSTQLLDVDPATALVQRLATVEELAPVWRYLVQTIHAGGDLARQFVDGLVEDATAYLAQATDEGVLVPSRDPEARAWFLTMVALGGAVLFSALDDRDDPQDAVRRWTERAAGPALEVYTHGLLADSTFLDAWLASREHVPPSDPSSGPTTHQS